MAGKLFMLMGAPGSGKSTWVQNHLDLNSLWVSRDNIRFKLVNENEKYFSKETQVFEEYVKQINWGLSNGYTVFADATHLNRKSRYKLLRRIIVPADEINIIWVKTNLPVALDRNENRKGTRAYVPPNQLSNMYYAIEAPSFKEGYKYIYIVEEDGKVKCYKEG